MSSRFLWELSARAFAQVIESKLDEDNRDYHGSSNRDTYGAGDKRSDCVGQSLKVDILIPLVAVVPVDTYLSPQLLSKEPETKALPRCVATCFVTTAVPGYSGETRERPSTS